MNKRTFKWQMSGVDGNNKIWFLYGFCDVFPDENMMVKVPQVAGAETMMQLTRGECNGVKCTGPYRINNVSWEEVTATE